MITMGDKGQIFFINLLLLNAEAFFIYQLLLENDE